MMTGLNNIDPSRGGPIMTSLIVAASQSGVTVSRRVTTIASQSILLVTPKPQFLLIRSRKTNQAREIKKDLRKSFKEQRLQMAGPLF